jgi:hypothetical protein
MEKVKIISRGTGLDEVAIDDFSYSDIDREIIQRIKESNGQYNPLEKKWLIPYTKVNNLLSALTNMNITTRYETAEKEIKADEIGAEFDNIISKVPSFLPYDYQKTAVEFLVNRHFAILGDGLGLGKTIESLISAKLLYDKKHFSKILVVCYPVSIIENWKREIKLISAGDENFEKAFTVTNYEQFRSKGSGELINQHYDIVICDEASQLRNPTKARKGLQELKSKYYWFLSGEVVEKYPLDLFYIITTFTSFYKKEEFYNNFVIEKPKYLYKKVINKVVGFKNISKLKEEISPIYLKRTREDVSNELKKVEIQAEYIRTPLTKEQEKEFGNIKKEIIMKRKIIGEDKNFMLEYFQKARLFLDDANYEDEEKEINSSKYASLTKIINENKAEKTIIFTSYKIILKKLERQLQKDGIKIITISSDMEKKERQEKIDEYKKSTDIFVLLTSDILAYGINLETSTLLINYDIPLLGGKLKQRIYRMVRATTKSDIVKNYILTTDTDFDRHVEEIIKKKIAYAEAINQNIDKIGVETIGFSIDEIKSIIKDIK